MPPIRAITAFTVARELGITPRFSITCDDTPEQDLAPFSKYLDRIITPDDVRIFELLHFGRATATITNASDAKAPDAKAVEACGSIQPLVDVRGRVYFCCVPLALDTYPPLLTRGNCKNKPLKSLLEEESDYWLIQALQAVGPDGVARKIGCSWPNDIIRQSLCERCIHLLRTPMFYTSDMEACSDQDFQENVSLLLYEMGNHKPLTKYLYEQLIKT